jgi:hypothetical protein
MLNCIDGVRILKVVFIFIILLMVSNVYAAQSTITASEFFEEKAKLKTGQ